MKTIINIAGYKFVTLADLKRRRQDLRLLCGRLELKGTILLSREGINLFLAGTRRGVDGFLEVLRAEPEFSDLQVKESRSDRQPFTRMLVRLKQEIIAFGVAGVDPAARPARRIPPRQLKEWLDEGKPVTLLDTRNDYEIELGTFRNAVRAGIEDFRQFPKAVARLPEELKHQPIVTFCTGGIRCEKAAPYMESAGFTDVYQLDGGILRYFEEIGAAHYEGDCFVFDQRVALDSALKESGMTQCYACQATLTPGDCRSLKYVPGRSCPHCFTTVEEAMRSRIEGYQAAIRERTDPLPGSQPYENRRPMRVRESQAGLPVLKFLESLKTGRTREEWLEICARGRVRINDRPVGPDRNLAAGECLVLIVPGTVEPDVNGKIEVLFEDDALVVLNKPAPLPMHAAGRYHRNTLEHILSGVFYPWKVRGAHRLDANTSGVLVCSKTRRVATDLQGQFERGEVEKRYLARVRGNPGWEKFDSSAPISREPGPAGGRTVDPEGLPARTEFRVLERSGDGTTLVEARPATGRTNQIRVHLWDLGLPVCGDPLYLQGRGLGEQQTLGTDAPPLCLQSSRIRLRHPLSGKVVEFEVPVPGWGRV